VPDGLSQPAATTQTTSAAASGQAPGRRRVGPTP
jgi:hypothetical protein